MDVLLAQQNKLDALNLNRMLTVAFELIANEICDILKKKLIFRDQL